MATRKQAGLRQALDRVGRGRGAAPAPSADPVDQWMAQVRALSDQALAGAPDPIPLPPALPAPTGAAPVAPPDATLVLLLDGYANAPMTLVELLRDLHGSLVEGLVVDVVAVLRGLHLDRAPNVARRYAEDRRVRLLVAHHDVPDGPCWAAALDLVRAPLAVLAKGITPQVYGQWVPHALVPLLEGVAGDLGGPRAVAPQDVRGAEPSVRVAPYRVRTVPPPVPDAVCLAVRTEEVRAVGGPARSGAHAGDPIPDLARRLRAAFGGSVQVADLTVPARSYVIPPAPARRPPRRARLEPAGGPASDAGAPRPEPALPELARPELARPELALPELAWSIWTPVPYGRQRFGWGDFYFANALAAALRRIGQSVAVDYVESLGRPGGRASDVVLALRGIQRFALPHEDAVSLLWVISHPDDVDPAELRDWDGVYAAGPQWAAEMASAAHRPVAYLPQCTDAGRFHPGVEPAESGVALLFAGNARGLRPVVADALAAGLGPELAIYGRGWADVLPAEAPAGVLRAERIRNEDLPAAYAGARIVLADHSDDMRRHGFLANRLFDAAATGARVVTDDTPGAQAPFGGLVRAYRSPEELAALVAADATGWPDPEQAQAAARAVVAEHSFDARARRLVRDVADLRAGNRSASSGVGVAGESALAR